MPKPSRKQEAPRLEDGDVVASVMDDAAFMALLDIDSYDKDLADWDYPSISKKVLEEMNAARVVAWGCPEVELNVRITLKPLGKRAAAKVAATTRGMLSTNGNLCLAGYTSVTMCAQFEDSTFPQPLDQAVSVEPGKYRVDVHRLFAHKRGEQFPEDEELPEGDHFVVVLTPEAESAGRAKAHREISWAPKPE